MEDTQARHAKALFHSALMTEELDELVEAREEARRKANEAHCWQAASDDGDNKVLESMLEMLQESNKFSAAQLEQLRPKLPAIPARRAEAATSNRFGSLSEPSGKEDSKGA